MRYIIKHVVSLNPGYVCLTQKTSCFNGLNMIIMYCTCTSLLLPTDRVTLSGINVLEHPNWIESHTGTTGVGHQLWTGVQFQFSVGFRVSSLAEVYEEEAAQELEVIFPDVNYKYGCT